MYVNQVNLVIHHNSKPMNLAIDLTPSLYLCLPSVNIPSGLLVMMSGKLFYVAIIDNIEWVFFVKETLMVNNIVSVSENNAAIV
jgi:hypothetical protein